MINVTVYLQIPNANCKNIGLSDKTLRRVEMNQ